MNSNYSYCAINRVVPLIVFSNFRIAVGTHYSRQYGILSAFNQIILDTFFCILRFLKYKTTRLEEHFLLIECSLIASVWYVYRINSSKIGYC